jgi:hypothetical protein
MKKGNKPVNAITLVDARLTDRTAVGDFAKDKLIQALERWEMTVNSGPFYTGTNDSITLLIGRHDDPWMRRALQVADLTVAPRDEGVFFGSMMDEDGHRVNLAGGTDGQGLAYALLELADRVADRGPSAVKALAPAVEYPHNSVRGVTRFIVNHHDERWMYDESFLRWWYARLVRARFNRVEYVIGFDTAYLSPPYPWFITVPGYEDLRVKGLSDEQRAHNLEGLRRMGQLAHAYGLEFSLASWQQKAWTSGQTTLIAGLPQDDDALIDYTEQAITRFLDACPEIDVLQLRVNLEAGVSGTDGVTTNESYWTRIIDAVAMSENPVELELRAKGLTNAMIRYAQTRGLATTVPTKYWCEHFPVPYHISRLRDEELDDLDNLNHSRRYSYADMLRKPRSFDLLYRLWNYGTTNVLEWGDPETARRFSRTCTFGDARGFVVTAPLSLQGGMEALDWEPRPVLEDPAFRVGPYEDDRYALWYLCFGRLGYNPTCSPEVWRRVLRTMVDPPSVPALEQALTAGGKILPLITTAHMPVHPSLLYWVEMSTGGALFPENNHNNRYRDTGYVNAKASDEGLFYGIADFVNDLVDRRVHGRYTPVQVAGWLRHLAGRVEIALEDLRKANASTRFPRTRTTLNDMQMLAALARYHYQKTFAAIRLALWLRTGSVTELRHSRAHMTAARERWTTLTELGEIYDHDLCFQLGSPDTNARRGYWRDRLPEMERDIDRLGELIDRADPESGGDPIPLVPITDTLGLHTMNLHAPERWTAGEAMPIRLTVPDGFSGEVTLHYRHTNLLEGDFRAVTMRSQGSAYLAEVPSDYLTPVWDLLVYASVPLSQTAVQIVPGLWHPSHPMPYQVIEIGRG